MKHMYNKIKQANIFNALTQIGIITFLLIFFIKICPLVAFDCDDWKYLGNFRLPIPIWRGEEPTRIAPETLMPAVGWLAARIIYPICGDYVYSVTVVSAMIITLLITVMCVCMQKLLIVRCNLTMNEAAACEILFIILHFLIFRNRGTSQCMFTAADLCCIYYYTISGILNAIVVLILLRFDDAAELFSSRKHTHKLLFMILLYFALFSNLFHSAITVIYAGIHLLMGLRCYARDFRQYIKKNILFLLILAAWGLILFFEVNGGRANVIGVDTNIDLVLAVRQLSAMIFALSKPFVMIMVLLAVITIFHILTGRLSKQAGIMQTLVILVCNMLMLTIFLLLLNSKLGYMSRTDATWGIWFYLITIMTVAAAYTIKTFPQAIKLLPVLLSLLMAAAIYPDGKFLMSTRENTDYQICVQLDQYVINNIMEAVHNGTDEIVIRIPDHSDDLRSLTYNEGLGEAVANCLYTQGIIAFKPTVQTIVDKNMNDVLENIADEYGKY